MSNTNRSLQLPRVLIEKLKLVVAKVKEWLQIRPIRIVIQVLILSFTIIYLIKSYQSVDLSKLEFTLNVINLIWAFLITVGALFLGGLGWWLTLISVGQTSRLSEAIKIHSISNLAKYIPGYAWQLLSKGYLTRKAGVSVKIIGIAMTLELSQIFLGGLWFIILFFPDGISRSSTFIHEAGVIFQIFRYSLLVIMALFPYLFAWIIRRLDPLGATVRLYPNYLALAYLSILVGWLLFGVAFWMIGNAILSLPVNTLPLFIFTLAVSFLVGLLIIIIPASIGVRESLMVFFLGNLLTAPIAVIVAALSRLLLTISELLFVALILMYSRVSQKTENNPHYS